MIYKVAEGFSSTESNPIINEKYSSSWIAYCLTNSEKYKVMNGGGLKSVYTLSVSKGYSNWKMYLKVKDTLPLNPNLIWAAD